MRFLEGHPLLRRAALGATAVGTAATLVACGSGSKDNPYANWDIGLNNIPAGTLAVDADCSTNPPTFNYAARPAEGDNTKEFDVLINNTLSIHVDNGQVGGEDPVRVETGSAFGGSNPIADITRPVGNTADAAKIVYESGAVVTVFGIPKTDENKAGARVTMQCPDGGSFEAAISGQGGTFGRNTTGRVAATHSPTR
jgi:hypothetical protein